MAEKSVLKAGSRYFTHIVAYT